MVERKPGHAVRNGFARFARAVNEAVASPLATFLAFLAIVVWAALGPHFHYSDAWQLVINTGTTIVTFLMVFVLNNAQSRDTAAVNTKLDAIIFAIKAADNRLIGLERRTDEETTELKEEILAAVEVPEPPKREHHQG